jgi:hypothetical protein
MKPHAKDILDEMDTATNAALTKVERDKIIIERIFPILCDRITALIGKPFRLIFDSTQPTASTDCIAEVRMNPWFFTEGHTEVGFGTGYHESGHIKFSPWGTTFLAEAHEWGGETLKYIANLILDRKDDLLTAQHAPGYADTLRRRLAYISTMSRRLERADQLDAYARRVTHPHPLHVKISKKQGENHHQTIEEHVTALLKNWKPKDAYEDFFFACKWHKRPRIRKVHKAMKLLTPKKLLDADPEKLLWIAQEIHAILGDPDEHEKDNLTPKMRKELRMEFEKKFIELCLLAAGIELGRSLDPALLGALGAIIDGTLKSQRKQAIARLIQWMRSHSSTSSSGPRSVGREHTVPVKRIPSNGTHAPAYTRLLASVLQYVQPLIRKLKALENPSYYTLHGRDEGDIDFREVARIATGLSGYRMERVEERNIDAEIHLALDRSGSMEGEKLETAKKIAVVFSEAIMALQPSCEGTIWTFNSRNIYDYGHPNKMSAFVAAVANEGNSDTHLLTVAGKRLQESKRRRKVLIMLCDDGPDDMEMAKRISYQLKSAGIIVIHMFIGVHGAPNIFPIELLFNTIEDCLEEFGDILEQVVKNLK